MLCVLSQKFPLLISLLWMAVLGAVATTGSGGVPSVGDGSKSTELTKQTEQQQHAVLKRSFNPFYGGAGNEWSGFVAPNAFQQWNK